MRTSRIIALSTITIAIAGYTGFWFYSASITKKKTEDILVSISNSELVESLNYDKITTSGFPFDIKHNIINPKLKLDLTHTLKSKDDISKDTYEMFTEIFPEEKLTIKINIFGGSLVFIPQGDINFINYYEGGKQHLVFTYQDKLEFGAINTLTNSAKNLFSDYIMKISSVYADLDLLELSMLMQYDEFFVRTKELQLKNKDNNEKLFEHGSLDLTVKLDAPKDEPLNFTTEISCQSKNFEVYPEQANFINNVLQSFLNQDKNSELKFWFADKASRYGKRTTNFNIVIHSSFNSEDEYPLELLVNLNSKNDLSQRKINFKFRSSNFDNKSDNHAEMAFNGDITYNPEAYLYHLADFNDGIELFEFIANFSDTEITSYQKMLVSFIKENDKLIVPNLAQNGPIHIEFDTKVKEKDNQIVSDKLNLLYTNNLYSIRLNGDYNEEASGVPEIDCKLTLGSYEDFIDSTSSLVEFLDKLNAIHNYPVPERVLVNFPNKAKMLLQKVANPTPNEKDININFIVNSLNPFGSVNGKDLGELAMLSNDIFMQN